MRDLFRVALTTGDQNGIGSEVTAKALHRLRPQKGTQLYLWRSHNMAKKELKLIDRYFKRVTVSSWPEALQQPGDFYRTLIDIDSPLPPAKWVELMAKAGHSKTINALVTAPLSKTEIIRSGFRDNGHTDILKRITKTKDVFMTFLGREFNVVLLTGHTSIKKAYDQIDSSKLKACLQQSQKLLKNLPAKLRQKPIAIVGCNPHAGEAGVIDSKEDQVYKPVIQNFRKGKNLVTDPLVPDVCFQKDEWKKYSIYIASYHDQGLIPFKMVHGKKDGVHLSLGLPFIRTSVDHGTAKDIFGKDKADSGSMEQAIISALKLLKNKPLTW